MKRGQGPWFAGIVGFASLVAGLAGMPPGAAGGLSTGYRIVDLGGLLGATAANGITADGFAAGYEMMGPSLPHAVLFSAGAVVDLGTLGGDASLANAVGSGGRVVGWARLPDSTRHAFLYEGGVMRDLGTLGGSYSMAFAINAPGEVVGASSVPDARGEIPFVWTDSTGMRALPVPAGAGGQALGINDSGILAGYYIDHGIVSAFRSDGVTFERLPDLERPGSKAYGISANGIAVGYGFAGEGFPHFHAAMWRGNTAQDLGALSGGESVAYHVNSAGDAVGFSYILGDTMVATLFTTGGIRNLNDLAAGTAWHLSMATSITDGGLISGLGTLDGVGRAFALVPDGLHAGPWGSPAPVTRLALGAWPSPMRESGTLELALPEADHGRVALYDVSGRRVAELASGEFPAGRARVAVGRDVVARAGSGVFYLRFDGARGSASRRIVIVR